MTDFDSLYRQALKLDNAKARALPGAFRIRDGLNGEYIGQADSIADAAYIGEIAAKQRLRYVKVFDADNNVVARFDRDGARLS